MKTLKNKTIAILFVSIMAISTLCSILPYVGAQLQITGGQIKTGAFLSVEPNPVGVGQSVQVTFWVSPIHPLPNDVFHGYKVTITRPDGTVENKGPYNSLGRQSIQLFTYIPTSVGEYTFHFEYPGEKFSSTNDTFLPATAQDVKLKVQEEPLPYYPLAPLPTEYWTRPINAQNTNWAPISGNWLFKGGYNGNQVGYGDSWGGFNPYTTAAATGHIMWTDQRNIGGLVGGDITGSYYAGATYAPLLDPPVIINGLAFYYTHNSGDVRPNTRLPGVKCVDLRTGEIKWTNSSMLFDFGQVWQYTQVPNQAGQGARAYLWGNTLTSDWKVYDAYTGELLFGYTKAESTGEWAWWPDEFMSGSDGTIYGYLLDGQNGWLAQWNSTLAYVNNGVTPNVANPKTNYNWLLGIQYNTTIPLHLVSGSATVYGGSVNNYGAVIGAVRQGIDSNVMLAKVTDGSERVYYEIGYDLTTGKELWVHGEDQSVGYFNSYVGSGIYATFDIVTARWVGYNIKTGLKLWTSDSSTGWGDFVAYGGVIADGVLYVGSYDGYLTAIDTANGRTLWRYFAGNSGTTTAYGSWPMWGGVIVGGGAVYVGGGQESPSNPLYPGYRLIAVNATTGQGMWNISGYFSVRAIADGYLMALNGYDSRVYTFGQGPSKTTIIAPGIGVTADTPITFTGSVTDIAAGTRQDQVASNYPNGLPCVSDASQSQFMEAVYMQQSMPTNVMGVQVTLTAIDPNQNFITLGTTTTDSSGNYGFTWIPPAVPGQYHITATFSGTNSYYGSSSTTYFAVQNAPATPGPTAPPVSDFASNNALMYGIVAIIIVIVIVGAVLALLMLKKRP
jgi:outer membrane protein assembly factor BamB